MKALTIRQPWASLVAVGAKTIETRGFATSYRGPLLIHAGKNPPEAGSRVGHYGIGHHRLTYADHIDEGYTLAETIGRQSPMGGAREYDTWPLPLGAVVASCQLVDCVPIVHAGGIVLGQEPCVAVRPEKMWTWRDGEQVDLTAERPFGDFSTEPTRPRYAWLLGDVRATTERCPRCWGEPMTIHAPVHALPADPSDDDVRAAVLCPTCRGGACAPAPMRGRQGLWTPKPDDWNT